MQVVRRCVDVTCSGVSLNLHGVDILLRQQVIQGPNVLPHLDEHAAVLLHKDKVNC